MAPPRPLLSCEAISKQFGARPLFQGLSLGIADGDHVGLVGPNGSGKSTLLKILAGLEEPDGGTRSVRKGVRVGYVPQVSSFPADATVEQVVIEALVPETLGGLALEEFEKAGRAIQALGKLGFVDARSFQRAFRRWTRMTPIAYQRSLRERAVLHA